MLRVRATEVVVVTEAGRFSGRATFEQGLGIIRAENTMGKTTLLMSVLYAMGLEGMLGPGDQLPLKPAVHQEVRDEAGVAYPVIESWVMVELDNCTGENLTLQRSVVGQDSPKLVHAWDGPAMTEPRAGYPAHDFFVRMEGAARRKSGLHHRLAAFIGLDLPEVATWSGNTVPLYLEILSSFLFVEQMRGWSGIAAVVPKYLQVRDPERRAVEFLTGLQALTRARDRDLVSSELSNVKADWRSTTDAFQTRVQEATGIVEGLPRDPPSSWPPAVPITVRILRDEQWAPLSDVLIALRAQLQEISVEVPRVEAVAEEAATQLREAEDRVAQISGSLAAASRDLREQQGELDALNERLGAIEEDRSRYADAIRLASLGSIQPLGDPHARCPTCEQDLPGALLGGHHVPVMTLEENKELLDQERLTFRAMQHDAEAVAVTSRQRLLALRSDLDDARKDVRSLKATLIQNAQAPSRAIIERQIRLAQRIEQLEALEAALVALDEELQPLADKTLELRAALSRLRPGATLPEDESRLLALETSVREQLSEYGFYSVPPDEIAIARDSYLPQRRDQPLVAKDMSASDNVRLIWAYLVGLLEVGAQFDTPHPGFVAFDEPGQQDISDESLAALFARLSRTRETGRQALVATSKPRDTLNILLDGAPAKINDFHGHTLQQQ